MVFIAASTRCFWDMPVFEACQQISELHFDKVELWIDKAASHLSLQKLISDPERFAVEFREQTRVAPVALAFEGDPEIVAFPLVCRAAKTLRITQITIPSAPLGTPFNTEIDRLKELVRIAVAEGVRVSLKTEKGRLTEDPHTAVEFCQSVKGLGITFDPSYFLTGNFEKICELVGPHTFHVHLRDSNAAEVQTQVGLGDLDYAKLISVLEKHRYERALCVDLIPEKTVPEQRALEMRKLRMLLDTLL
jgi:sugar phosphate isomerase/epimerase